MICQFSFENFKSFKDEAFLDFCAESISDNANSLIIDKDNEKFLPVVTIYGPNGGGKSTVLEALSYLRDLVVQPVIASKINEDISAEEEIILKKYLKKSNREKFHKFDKSCASRPIRFEIMYRVKGMEYQYEISILKSEIVSENLYYKTVGQENVVLVYERTEEECIIGDDISFVSIERIKKSLPLLSHIATSYDIKVIDNALSWFMHMNFVNYDNPVKDKQLYIPKQEKEQELFFSMMREMDINILGVRIEEDADGNIKEVFTKHKIGEEEIEIPMQEESSGTRKIFSCLAKINDCLQKGNLLIADELDAKLHPKLMRYIIELFTNSQMNKNGAQLLITSHDIINMTPEIFRRDEIWFCALNQNNASKLYSLISLGNC